MNLIVTELAVIEVTPQGLLLREVAPGVTPEDVQKATEPTLQLAPDLANDRRLTNTSDGRITFALRTHGAAAGACGTIQSSSENRWRIAQEKRWSRIRLSW